MQAEAHGVCAAAEVLAECCCVRAGAGQRGGALRTFARHGSGNGRRSGFSRRLKIFFRSVKWLQKGLADTLYAFGCYGGRIGKFKTIGDLKPLGD